jgi:hypothetical protein
MRARTLSPSGLDEGRVLGISSHMAWNGTHHQHQTCICNNQMYSFWPSELSGSEADGMEVARAVGCSPSSLRSDVSVHQDGHEEGDEVTPPLQHACDGRKVIFDVTQDES